MKISQAEARRLKRRVVELEDERRAQRRRWASEYPGGVHLGSLSRNKDWLTGRIDGAHMLGHAVVIRQNDDGDLHFFALPLA